MVMTMMSSRLLLLCLLCAFLPQTSAAGLVESERLEEYKARNYTWPLKELVPNTPGWHRIIDRRFQQIEAMEGGGQRYEGYMQTMSSALTVPNFTENGWGLTRVNNDLLEALQKGIRDGLPNASHESRLEVIEGDEPPLFINRPDLTKRVLKEVQPLCEAWSQTPLKGYRACMYCPLIKYSRAHAKILIHSNIAHHSLCRWVSSLSKQFPPLHAYGQDSDSYCVCHSSH